MSYSSSGEVNINFNATDRISGVMDSIQNSAKTLLTVDKRTAQYAAELIERRLKNVLIEPSSSAGSSTHKRIRLR